MSRLKLNPFLAPGAPPLPPPSVAMSKDDREREALRIRDELRLATIPKFEIALECLKAGMSVSETVRKCGATERSVTKWRDRLGFSAYPRGAGLTTLVDYRCAIVLYARLRNWRAVSRALRPDLRYFNARHFFTRRGINDEAIEKILSLPPQEMETVIEGIYSSPCAADGHFSPEDAMRRAGKPYAKARVSDGKDAQIQISRLKSELLEARAEIQNLNHIIALTKTISAAHETSVEQSADIVKILRPQECAIFNVLGKHMGKFVTTEKIVEAIYGHRQDGGPVTALASIRSCIWKMRKRLGMSHKDLVGSANRGYMLVRIPTPEEIRKAQENVPEIR